MKPFLKWAGSKYKILDRILTSLPQGKRLIEPFAGSGAVFLNANFETNLIADTNADLINLFKLVQSEGADFIDSAALIFNDLNNTEDNFYLLREEFNASLDIRRKAQLFIYLNRHCFNGLCRYNAKGKFNVPFGRYSKPTFPFAELHNFHLQSQRATFELVDFKTTMAKAELGDVVYCDPPYAPLTLTANFSDYTMAGFSQHDQEELASSAEALTRRGIPVIISNHDTAFTRQIYAGAEIKSFDVQRFISSDAANRGKAAELLALYA